MKNSKKMAEVIEKKRALSEEKTPKYGTRKLSIGLVSCMLGFSLIIAPGSSKAAEETDSTEKVETVVSDKEIPETPVVEETKPVENNSVETPLPAETTNKSQAETETTTETQQVKEVKQNQADNFTPQLKTITVNQGESVEDYKKAITNLPQDAELNGITPVDTKEAGEKTVKATITFSDGSTKEIELKVNVNPAEKTEENKDADTLEISPEKSEADQENVKADGTETSNEAQKNLPKNRSQETNWADALVDDERNWAVDLEGGQKIVRVTTSDPTQITDLNYDSTYVDAEGRTNIRLVYREKRNSLQRYGRDYY